MSVLGLDAACSVAGCDRRRAASGRPPGRSAFCGVHKSRKQRTGDVQAHVPVVPRNAGPWLRPDGYLAEWRPGHPVSTRNGEALVHRRVLFDTIGDGTHPCHWCDVEVTWGLVKRDPKLLVVDHVDEDKQNNVPSNLVPSCLPCNVKRSPKGRASRVSA